MIILLLGLGILSATHQRNPSIDKEHPREPSSGTPIAQNPSPNQSQKQEEMEWFYQFIQWPEGITTLAIILTLGAIIWQSDETRKAAQATKENVEMFAESQGPQLVITSHNDPRKDIFASPARIQMELRNHGPTTAFDVITEYWMEVLPFEALDFTDKAFHHVSTDPISLYPTQDPVILNCPLGRDLSPVERDQVKSLVKKVCVRSKITYHDAFSPVRRYANFGHILQNEGMGFMAKYNDSGVEK